MALVSLRLNIINDLKNFDRLAFVRLNFKERSFPFPAIPTLKA